MNNARVPVVVVGGTLNGLGVVRCLSAARVPVYLIDTTRDCAAAWSRHCAFVRAPALEGEGLVGTLVELAKDLASRPVLLLTSDQTVMTVAECRDRLDSHYRIVLPPAKTVAELANKAAFHRLAEDAGFAVPRSVPVNSPADFDRLNELAPPLVIKPADKRLVLTGIVDRAVRTATTAEALAIAGPMLERAGSLVVQEWVEGADSDIFFTLFYCDGESRILGSFAGRKLVCSPPAVGNTAICVAAPEAAADLDAQTLQFINRVGYVGLGGIEFKRDVRTGKLLIIEPTVGRTDLQEEIATLCGVNLPLLAYRATLAKLSPIVGSGSMDVAWRCSSEFRLPSGLRAPPVRIVDGFFRWSDPLPAVYYYCYDRVARRIWRRALGPIRKVFKRTRRSPQVDFDTTIVGAGPYGLTVAAHLRPRRISYQMFGSPLESWRRYMPEGMILKSEPFASNLWDPHRRFTLERYFRHRNYRYQAVGAPLSLARFLEYADWFRNNNCDVPDETRITRIQAAAPGFTLTLSDGRTVRSRRVILATGHMPFKLMPPELAHLPEPRVAHSSRMSELSCYAGRHVTVIGAGQSALESAAILHEAGARVRVLVRRSRIEWNSPSKPRPLWQQILRPEAGIASGWGSWALSEMPRVFRWRYPPSKRHPFVATSYGASGAWWLRDRVDGRIEIWLGTKIEAASLEGEQVRLQVARQEGRQEILTDYLISATGYRVDIDRLEYLDPALRQGIRREAGGIPALSSRFETSVPGLFIIGVASSPVFGPIMRFMYGAKHVGPVLAAG